MAPYIISGLVVGSIYAISALGLVLTYTSSRVFNFAHGAIAYSMAIFYYYLTRKNGWSIPSAAILTIGVVAPALGLFLYLALFRRLAHASPTVRLVSTVGLWVALPALTKILFPFATEEILLPQGLISSPADPHFWRVFGTWINENQFAVMLSALTIAVLATVTLRYTPFGLAIRATVDQPRNAAIAGVNTEGVTAVSWMVGTMLAAFAGVLLAPILGMQEFYFTLLLVGSFAAVVVAKMTSLPIAFGAAIAIGLAQQIWVKIQPTSGFFAKGVNESIPFLVMLGFLVVYGFTSGGLRREAFEIDRRRAGGLHGDAPPLPPAHGWRRAAGLLLGALALAAIPAVFNDFWLAVLTQGMTLAIIFLSYTMITGEGGMISLCQITLAGIGGFGAARLASEAGWPVWLAILAGALIAVPFGLLVALPSLRIGDLYLALLTLGFAILIEQLVWTRNEYDNFGAGVSIGRPFGLSVDDRLAMYVIVAAVFAAVSLLIVNMKRATTGLVFAAIRSSEPASLTSGISIVRAKLVLFATSAFVAGLGGALYASVVGVATVRSFTVLIGIVWLAIVVTWGVRSVLGAALAGLIFAAVPQKLSVILILVLVFVTGGVFTRVLLARGYRTVPGAALMMAMAALGVGGSLWIWDEDHVTNDDTVKVILVLLAVGLGTVVVTRLLRSRLGKRPLGIMTAVTVAALAALLAYEGANLDLGDSALQVPTMLFGLGAIGLAREPRGVIYDMVNRQRLRQIEDADRRAEKRAALADVREIAGVTA